MLRPLLEYARKEGLEAEPGFAPKSARWCIDIAADGRLLGVIELGDPDQKRNPGRPFPKARPSGCATSITASTSSDAWTTDSSWATGRKTECGDRGGPVG